MTAPKRRCLQARAAQNVSLGVYHHHMGVQGVSACAGAGHLHHRMG